MKITVKNPIDNSDVEVELNVTTSLSTFENGSMMLSVHGRGEVMLNEAITDEVIAES
jgi:hypothetical protein